MGGGHIMKRIPLIKFPQRHSSSSSGIKPAPKEGDNKKLFGSNSEVPASPSNMGVGGKASLQPKRTPVSDKEIEAVMTQNTHISSETSVMDLARGDMLGGCI